MPDDGDDGARVRMQSYATFCRRRRYRLISDSYYSISSQIRSVCCTNSWHTFKQHHADTIASCWKFSTHGERDQFEAKIRRLPSIGVQSHDGTLASFTVLDASGFFNNQFTFVEHRQRGLADRSELKLCQKVISFGLYPMKFVEHETRLFSTALADHNGGVL
ncbi:hypothetical protein DINM_022113 [Dirofilaria immitis]|nr:hypothetical protein [Dirofilaria immitis]